MRPKQKPNFFWHAVLILLPVLVLAGVASVSLRQDKRLAENEATEKAQTLAEDLLERIGARLAQVNTNERMPGPWAFQVDTAGQLLFPPPVADWPTPNPLALVELNPEQARLWQAAWQQQLEHTNLFSIEESYLRFLASNPPVRFAALGRYALGLVLMEMGKVDKARELYLELASKNADILGETGLPLLPFVQLKLFEWANDQTEKRTFDAFCSNAVHTPTPLTPMLLAKANELGNAAPKKWRQVWDQHELARSLYRAACRNFGQNYFIRQTTNSWRNVSPQLFWFDALEIPSAGQAKENPGNRANAPRISDKQEQWLAVMCLEQENNCWFICKTESQVNREMLTVADLIQQIPEYFGLEFELLGKKLIRSSMDLRLWTAHHYAGKGGGWGKSYLEKDASTLDLLASAARTEDGKNLLKVNVYLTSPATLFARQRARTFWFSALIGTSAAAALLGLLSSWRTFHRQQQLSELKSNFVSSVSHELRAPIASVRLMAESLQRGKVSAPAKQQEYYQFIVQECRRLSSLVENVLDFSRIEQGRKEYEFEPTDIIALTRQTVHLLEPYASERQVTLMLAIPDSQSPMADSGQVNTGRTSSHESQTSSCESQIHLDGKAIQQALVNLIDNAIKHSPKGGVVTVGLDLSGAKNGEPSAPALRPNDQQSCAFLSLFVEDRGEGIPLEQHEKIFERFYRLGSELRRETQGVGIGLSIVKHIVEAHGGKVSVRSAVREGSRFTIELPLKNDE